MTDKEVINILAQIIIYDGSFIYDDKYKSLNFTKEQLDYVFNIIVNIAFNELKKEMLSFLDSKDGELNE